MQATIKPMFRKASFSPEKYAVFLSILAPKSEIKRGDISIRSMRKITVLLLWTRIQNFYTTVFLLILMRYDIRNMLILSIVIPTLGLTIFAQHGLISINSAHAQDETGQQQEREFSANLTGLAELPPVMTNASGQATFTLNEDGDEVSYDLEVQDVEGVVSAHIHWGNPLRNGPILVTLYDDNEPTDEVDGSLTDGDFTSVDVVAELPEREARVWQTLGQNMSGLITLMEEGRTYVNVHTLANPAGEIRGTIEEIQEVNTQENNDNGNNDDI
jgi:hypothetical protein